MIGGNYGWAVKEGTFLFNRATGTIGGEQPGRPRGLDRPDLRPAGDAAVRPRRRHLDHRRIRLSRHAIPELFGKYVFGDLAIRNAPPRVDGRLFYADLEDGTINEFLLPQFANDQLPNGLTVHGFGEDGNGELYALVTNTPANGTGGIIYKLIPEPGSFVLLGIGILGALVFARRSWRGVR